MPLGTMQSTLTIIRKTKLTAKHMMIIRSSELLEGLNYKERNNN
jgi:hypothetical protein